MGTRPDVKLMFKHAKTKKSVEVGVGWTSEYGGFNISPRLESDLDGDFPHMDLREALDLVAKKDGYINLYAIGKENNVTIVPNESDDEF